MPAMHNHAYIMASWLLKLILTAIAVACINKLCSFLLISYKGLNYFNYVYIYIYIYIYIATYVKTILIISSQNIEITL